MKPTRPAGLWWLLIGASVFMLLVVSTGGAYAQDNRPIPTGPADRESADPEDFVEKETSRVVYHLVGSNARVTSYDYKDNQSRKDSLDDAIFDDDEADLRFIVFDDVAVLKELRSSQRRKLLDKFENRQWAIGVRGLLSDLKKALDLLPPDLEEAGTSSGGDDRWVLLKRNPSGILSELTIAAPNKNHRAARETAFRYMRDWYNRNEKPSDNNAAGTSLGSGGDDPWNSIYLYESQGTTLADFENTDNEHAGTYKFTLTIFTLASDQNGMDWYRIDFQTISEITEYEMTGNKFGDTSGKCGWWTDSVKASAKVETTGGQWWDYMPSTTVGSTTTSFSIGGNITTSQAGISGSYSQSYGTPDVTITVLANSVEQTIDWTASLVGCHNYSWYPDYSGASNAAKTTYDLNPSFIAAVPAGSALKIKTEGTNSWQFTVRKDKIKLCGFADTSVCHTAYTETYTRTPTITCNKTSCS